MAQVDRMPDALPLAALGWAYLGYAYLAQVLRLKAVPVCLFRLITGHACPLCGMTHAFGRLMAGDIAGAEQFNVLAVPAFVGWVATTLICTAKVAGATAENPPTATDH